MFPHLFEDRDKRVALLIKMGDCLGRSLRENVILFSVNSNDEKVTYLTESNKIIEANYVLGGDVELTNISIHESSIFEDDELYDSFVENTISSFIENIHYNELSEAENSFQNVLDVWHNRMKLGSVQKRLFEKTQKLAGIEKIVESDEFSKVVEIAPQIVDFLREKKDKVTSVPEVRNAVQLSNSISEAFDFPRLSYDNLDGESYRLKDGRQGSIYEMICRQELVKKELVESKKQFSYIWATSPAVKSLAGSIFESEEVIEEALLTVLSEVPYFALASKKALTETFTNCLARVGEIGVSETDIKEFSSRIFEAKKDSRDLLEQMLNEKYGVDIQNLQEPVSFKSLSNTQVVIFETLSRLAPNGSVLKQTLAEAAQFMKGKYGVECIDVNDLIFEMFSAAGYMEEFQLDEEKTVEKVDLKRVANKLREAAVKVRPSKKKKPNPENDAQKESDETIAEDEAAVAQPDLGTEPAAEEDYSEPKDSKPDSEEDTVGDLAELDNILGDIVKDLDIPTEQDSEDDE